MTCQITCLHANKYVECCKNTSLTCIFKHSFIFYTRNRASQTPWVSSSTPCWVHDWGFHCLQFAFLFILSPNCVGVTGGTVSGGSPRPLSIWLQCRSPVRNTKHAVLPKAACKTGNQMTNDLTSIQVRVYVSDLLLSNPYSSIISYHLDVCMS